MAWAKNGTPDTLSSSNANLTISDLTVKTCHVFLHHSIRHTLVSPVSNMIIRFDNNSGSVYSQRGSQDGAADYSTTSTTSIFAGKNTTCDSRFSITYCVDIDGEEKLIQGFECFNGSSGATNAPGRVEFTGKYVEGSTDPQVTRVDTISTNTNGDYDTDSNLSALGTD